MSEQSHHTEASQAQQSEQKIRVFGCTKYGRFDEVLGEHQVPKPTASGQDLLVKVHAVATNPIDFKRIDNLGNSSAHVAKEPFIPGWDCCGVVEAVGEGVTLFKVGDEVMFAGAFERDGCFGEYAIVDERIVGRKPKKLDWKNSAAIPLVFITVWESFVEQMRIPVPQTDEEREANKSKVVLITAGAGGVGSIAIQFASKVLGMTVVATASRPESAEWCQKMGAHYVINHFEPFKPQLDNLAVEGVDYALPCYDLDKHLGEISTVIKPLGFVCGIFLVSEGMGQLDWFPLFTKRVTVTFEFMFTRPLVGAEPERQGQALNFAAELYDAGTLESTVTQSFPFTLEGLKQALEVQRSGKAMGKLALE